MIWKQVCHAPNPCLKQPGLQSEPLVEAAAMALSRPWRSICDGGMNSTQFEAAKVFVSRPTGFGFVRCLLRHFPAEQASRRHPLTMLRHTVLYSHIADAAV